MERSGKHKSKGDASLRKSIREAAAQGLRSFPSERAISHDDKDVVEFLTRARNLVEEGMKAGDWDDDQLKSYAERTGLMYIGYKAGGAVAATPAESCTAVCSRERRECIGIECGPGSHSWPCFCCAPCNIAWMACLAACVVN